MEGISSAYTTPNGEQLITEKMKQKCVVIMLKSKLAPTEDTFPPHVTEHLRFIARLMSFAARETENNLSFHRAIGADQ